MIGETSLDPHEKRFELIKTKFENISKHKRTSGPDLSASTSRTSLFDSHLTSKNETRRTKPVISGYNDVYEHSAAKNKVLKRTDLSLPNFAKMPNLSDSSKARETNLHKESEYSPGSDPYKTKIE